MHNSVRFVLIDDHPLMLEALGTRVNAEPDMEVVGMACDSENGFRVCLTERPDVVVLNVELPGRGAFTIAEELQRRVPAARVVFLTEFLTDVFLDEALRLNAHGYFLLSEPPDELMAGLRSAAQGQPTFSAAVADRLEYDPVEGRYLVKATTYLSTLTNRQLEVLRHLVRGESVKEVARTMILSERAIESHKYRIMRKLGIHDRVELARYAIREGLSIP